MAEGSAGLIGKVEAAGEFDLSSAASAQGGKIETGTTFNFVGGNFGLVKILTFAGITLLALKILRK